MTSRFRGDPILTATGGSMYDKMFELEMERRVRDLASRPGGTYVETVGGRHHLYVDGKLMAVVNSVDALDAAKQLLLGDRFGT